MVGVGFSSEKVIDVRSVERKKEDENILRHKLGVTKRAFNPHLERYEQAAKEDAMINEFLTRAIQAAHAGMVRLFVRPDGDGIFYAKDDNGLVFLSDYMKPNNFFTKRIAAREPSFQPNPPMKSWLAPPFDPIRMTTVPAVKSPGL